VSAGAEQPGTGDQAAYVDANFDRFVGDLAEYCRHPSWGGHASGMDACAAWLRAKLASIGFDVELVSREGSHAVVWARKAGASPRTVLFFNHYDIANYTSGTPPELLDGLTPVVRDGKFFCRGAADDKGTGLSRVHAAEALLATGGLPCNVVFLIEGKQQVGDPTLPDFVERYVKPLAPDIVIWETGPKDELERPVMSLGAKGYLYLEVTAPGASREIYSRQNVFPNPAWDLTWALATLKNRGERILVDGFYDTVRPLNADEEAMLDEMVTTDFQLMPQQVGLDGFLLGEEGRAVVRRLYCEPSLTICGLESGHTGPGVRLSIPQRARAKLEFRLVADQDPFAVLELVRAHFQKIGLAQLELVVLGHSTPYRSPVTHPCVQAVQRAARRVYGREMVAKPNSTGMSQKYLFRPAPTAGIGVEYWGSRMEQPDEHIRLEDYRQGVKQIVATIDELSKT
jgi:acetylornithine deacetylase/succinyl-diaminopimelate desuccinylase-like protein